MDFRVDESGDIVPQASAFASDGELESAILLSLFTDRRAIDDDELEDGEDPRGWWGDSFARVAGDLVGSRLWTLRREKLTTQVEAQARAICEEALAWLVEDGIASRVEVALERVDGGRLDIAVTVHREAGGAQRYAFAWDRVSAVADDGVRRLYIDEDVLDYDIFARAGSPSGRVTVEVYVRAVVGSSSSASPAMTTGTGWHASSEIRIVLDSTRGYIAGRGGDGGQGATLHLPPTFFHSGGGGGGGAGRAASLGGVSQGPGDGKPGSLEIGGLGGAGALFSSSSQVSAAAGGAGGVALELLHRVSIANLDGVIQGGGGGGGGAGAGDFTQVGGNGGAPGEPGTAGVNGAAGGTGGKAVTSNGHPIQWIEVGTIRGEVA